MSERREGAVGVTLGLGISRNVENESMSSLLNEGILDGEASELGRVGGS